MRHPRYGFSSCAGMLGGRIDLRRPPILPVMRAQLAATDPATSDLLNAHALLRWNRPVVLVFRVQQPLPYSNRRDLQRSRQSALAAANFNGATQSREVGGFHGRG